MPIDWFEIVPASSPVGSRQLPSLPVSDVVFRNRTVAPASKDVPSGVTRCRRPIPASIFFLPRLRGRSCPAGLPATTLFIPFSVPVDTRTASVSVHFWVGRWNCGCVPFCRCFVTSTTTPHKRNPQEGDSLFVSSDTDRMYCRRCFRPTFTARSRQRFIRCCYRDVSASVL